MRNVKNPVRVPTVKSIMSANPAAHVDVLGGVPEMYPAFRGMGRTVEERAAAKVGILPVHWASDGSRGRGDGPRAMLAASIWIGGYEEESGLDPAKIGFSTLSPIMQNTWEESIEATTRTTKKIIGAGLLPVIVGADRIASIGAINAIREKDESFAVVQFDARPHIQNEGRFLGPISNFLGHRLAQGKIPTMQVGLRGMAEIEIQTLSTGNANFHTARRLAQRDPTSVAADLLRSLPESIYITLDLSVIDSVVMPSVELPLPFGLQPDFVTTVLRFLIASRRIVGMDVCGLAPISGNPAPNALAAAILNRMLASYAKKLI